MSAIVQIRGGAPVPVVSLASFTVAAGYGLDALVGHVIASNTPTSYAIVSGNSGDWFAIYSSGNIRTSETIVVPPDNYVLGVTATNANGTSAPATISVVMEDVGDDFPDATNTGVPVGETLTPHVGNLTLSTPGATTTNLDIQGTVSITASNVTLVNCKVRSSHENALIGLGGSVDNVTIQDCEIYGGGSSYYGILNRSGGTNNLYLRCNIHGSENGIDPGDGDEVRDCYIHGILNTDNVDPHYDGIEYDGGNGLLVEHTTIDMSELDTNAAIMIDNFFSALSNVTVNNCLLRGANYTMWLDGRFSGGSVSNVIITNNHIQTGNHGYYLYQGAYTPIHTGNVDWITLVSID